jgi:hypothetical protein
MQPGISAGRPWGFCGQAGRDETGRQGTRRHGPYLGTAQGRVKRCLHGLPPVGEVAPGSKSSRATVFGDKAVPTPPLGGSRVIEADPSKGGRKQPPNHNVFGARR